MTPNSPQNFEENPDVESSEDELIRAYVSIDRSKSPDPTTFEESQNSPYAKHWMEAMEKEINDLAAQNTWKLVDLPPNRQALKGRWVFKTKIGANGEIEKYKARWVVKGFLQKFGIDFTETFSNTVKPMAYKALFAWAAYRDLEIQQWDVKSAFPNASLKEEIYMEQPIGFKNQKYPTRVCLLLKALYGLKQSAREWYLFLAEILTKLGFKTLVADQSIFRKEDIIICAYIDDLLVFGPNLSEIQALKSEITKIVDLTDLGNISFFLEIQITRNYTKRAIYINQTKFTKELIN